MHYLEFLNYSELNFSTARELAKDNWTGNSSIQAGWRDKNITGSEGLNETQARYQKSDRKASRLATI